MKKHFLFAFAAITALLMTACSEDDIVKGQGGNTVTFSVGVPQLATRAIGEGNSANKLYWGVYDHNNVLLTEISNTAVGQDFSQKGTVHLTLAQDKKYSIIFWAANASNSMCTVNWNDRTMSVNPTTANQEAYDAFCAYVTIDNVSGYAKRDVTLYRPFAQLNIGTADVEKAGKSGLTVKNTKVEISGIPTTYNFVDGTTAGSETFTYDYPATATSFENEVFPVSGFDYLAMNYALVAADKELVTVKFTYKDDDNQEHLRTYTSVPVQRNWRTNIYGNILTSEADFTVTIEPEFADDTNPDSVHNIEVWDGKTTNAPVITQDENGEEIAVVSTGSQLAYVAQVLSGNTPNNAPATRTGETVDYATMTIVLDADLDLGNEEWLPVGTATNPFKGTFDGNGFTIHNLKVTGNNSNVGLFGVTHDGEIKNLILNNANVSGRLNVGAVAGQPYTSKYTDITVKGHVEVKGMAYVGGVGGKDAYANWTNITVDVDATSFVKANSVENGTAYRTYVGGVVGFNGEGGHTFKNITSNINVEGSTLDVGGLFGIAHYGNKFENCVCTGNVVNNIDKAEYALQTGGIAGVWNNGGENVEFTNCSFKGTLSAPNAGDVNFYYNGLVGAPYSAAGPGKLIINGEVAVASVEALQAAIDAAAEGETTIALYADMVGDVTVVQKQGVKITIKGGDNKYNGSIKVHSNSNFYADAALTIQNVNFESSAASVNFIEALENGAQRYSTNITVDGCTFTATGEGVNTSVGVQIKASKNAKVLNCTATGVHSLLQAQSCDETVVVTNCEINGKNGVAFKQVKAATVEGTTITALEYGIRFDGNTDNYGIVVKNNNITAAQPFIVRKMTGKNNTIVLEGENTFTTDEYFKIVITNGSDDEAYVAPTGTYTLTGAEAYNVFPDYVNIATEAELKDAFALGIRNISLNADIALTEAWTPVGNAEKPWYGVFDGKNHKISGLSVEGVEYAAFISHTAANSTVKNLTLENVNLNSTKHAAGVVCVAGDGLTLENITVNGEIKAASYAGGIMHNGANATIKNCENNANVTANRAGGIASWATVGANIEGVVNYGNITGGVGASGIAHGFAGTIKNANNRGTIISNGSEPAAGIAGVQKASSTYEYCYNYGNVTSTQDNPNSSAAGILGQAPSTAYTSTLKYCANYGEIKAEKSYAAGIAYSLYGTINASYCYNNGAVYGADGAGAIAPKAQYGAGDKANYCLNAGVITSNGIVYQGSNNNVSCYYYNNGELYNVKDNTVADVNAALALLNGGTDAEFFTLVNGLISVVIE